MSDLPAPLVPADCDLRDFVYMPVDIVRLFNSEFHARSTDAEWRAGVTLWLKSYHQVPASSLPDDDIALARLAELGRDLRAWRKIKDGALRGWTRCSDGRLYHRTVAEKALEGWIERLAQRKSSAAGNAKRYAYAFDPKPFDEAIEASRQLLVALNPQSRVLAKRGGKPASNAPVGSPDIAPVGSPERAADTPPDNLPSGSQGTGKVDISVSLRSTETRADDPPDARCKPNPKRPRRTPDFPRDAFERWYDLYPHKVARGAAENAFSKVLRSGEATLDELIGGTEHYIRTKNPEHAWCNPATWLNQRRWLDKPASSLSVSPTPSTGQDRVDFGGGVVWPEPTVVAAVERWRTDPSTWPLDRIGPPPGMPGCRVPERLLEAA